MAQTYYDTEQKLKNYLATDQLKQERLCMSVLSLNKKYSNITPRQPYGGPDHGRDIQAIYDETYLCFIAVGFKQDANDSSEQINQIKKKFKDDLTNALTNAKKENLDLKGFVFFTNLKLTVDIIAELKQTAIKSGLLYCDIYNREQILQTLNTPDGYAIRFEFLDISLTEEEQKAFFTKWGNDIRSVISNGFDQQKKAVDRMIFLQEALLPLDNLAIVLKLNKEYKAEEIGHFRIVVFLAIPSTKKIDENIDAIKVVLCQTDNSTRLKENFNKSQSGIDKGISGYDGFEVYDNTLEEKKFRYFQMSTSSGIGRESVRSFYLDYSPNSILRIPPEFKIADFDKAFFMSCVSENLCDKIESIHIFMNSYEIFKVSSSDIVFDNIMENTFDDFPVMFTEEELEIPWKRTFYKNGNSIQLDFTSNTPKRVCDF